MREDTVIVSGPGHQGLQGRGQWSCLGSSGTWAGRLRGSWSADQLV